MFMMSFRLKRTFLVAGGLVLAAALVLGAVNVSGIWSGRDTVAADSATPKGNSPTAKMKKVPAKTEAERMSFITSYGWEVEAEPAEIMEVVIPKEFDEVYEQYNAIQKRQGCDLKEYAGKRCKRYSYVVTNYPGTEDAVRINILVYKNKVIGGDVCSLAVEGFIHGFDAPK